MLSYIIGNVMSFLAHRHHCTCIFRMKEWKRWSDFMSFYLNSFTKHRWSQVIISFECFVNLLESKRVDLKQHCSMIYYEYEIEMWRSNDNNQQLTRYHSCNSSTSILRVWNKLSTILSPNKVTWNSQSIFAIEQNPHPPERLWELPELHSA
jgi:hypothetical protein